MRLGHRLLVPALLCAAFVFACDEASGPPLGPIALVDGGTDSALPPSDAYVPVAGDAVRIANLNCKNLFNDVIDSPNTMAGAEAESTPSAAGYQAHLKALAEQLLKLKGDVVFLQEVENDATLAALQARPELGGMYKHRSLTEGNDPRGIDIAVLSKFPLKVTSHAEEKVYAPGFPNYWYKYARDVVEAHIAGPSGEFVALGVHYRSQLSSATVDDDKKRLAEANGTRAIADKLLQENASRPVLVLGDFNDVPDSPPLLLLKNGTPSLVAAHTEVPTTEQWSITYGGAKLLYDMQLASPAMWKRYVKGSAAFLRSPNAASDHSGFAASYKL